MCSGRYYVDCSWIYLLLELRQLTLQDRQWNHCLYRRSMEKSICHRYRGCKLTIVRVIPTPVVYSYQNSNQQKVASFLQFDKKMLRCVLLGTTLILVGYICCRDSVNLLSKIGNGTLVYIVGPWKRVYCMDTGAVNLPLFGLYPLPSCTITLSHLIIMFFWYIYSLVIIHA